MAARWIARLGIAPASPGAGIFVRRGGRKDASLRPKPNSALPHRYEGLGRRGGPLDKLGDAEERHGARLYYVYV